VLGDLTMLIVPLFPGDTRRLGELSGDGPPIPRRPPVPVF